MQSLQQIPIFGSASGLQTNVKPFLLPDQAFQKLNNAYIYRDRVKKREGLRFLGRLRRAISIESLGVSGVSPWTFNVYSTLAIPITGEPNAEIQSGDATFLITVGVDTFIDLGNGTLQRNDGNTQSTINYVTGNITLVLTVAPGTAATITFHYFPLLPTMGIDVRETQNINNEQTIFFDTKYAYIYSNPNFDEFIPGFTWTGSDSDFFWCTNYRGSTPDARLFFETNFVNSATSPMRYTDLAAIAWTDFKPAVDATNFLITAKILIPYYGRLLALNVYEGPNYGIGASNIFNRCRFSQIGSPIAADAWRSDQFGKGGFIDAPTSEQIMSATFFKNTLIVRFERSTWQLRYVGEYGLPFLWERISSDFGADSAFSDVLFDDFVLSVGDKAITASTASGTKRIDLQIPDTVFSFKNANNDNQRIQSARDFRKETVYWNYVGTADESSVQGKFPNHVLIYNYRNNTYGIFRDNVTAFGTFQNPNGITWDSTDVLWQDTNVTWDDPGEQSLYPDIVCGNQHGFISIYADIDQTEDDTSLTITAIDLTSIPITLTVPNHNFSQNEIIYLTGTLFVDSMNVSVDPGINNQIYLVTVIDDDNIQLYKWNGTNYVSVTTSFTYTYIGGGKIALFPLMEVQTKDFNPFQQDGQQLKLSYIDFLTDASPGAAVAIKLFINSSDSVQGNLLVGNEEVETSNNSFGYLSNVSLTNPCQVTSIQHGLTTGQNINISQVIGTTQLNNNNYTITIIDDDNFTLDGIDATAFGAYVSGGRWDANSSIYYLPSSIYTWHRFYATSFGQYINVLITYDDVLRNQLNTYTSKFEMNAFNIWVRRGGKIVF